MPRSARRANTLLFSDQILGSVVNKRLPAVELDALYTGALFQLAVLDVAGLTAFSCRLYGSIDGITFPPVGVSAEALVSTAVILKVGESMLRQPTVLTADGAAAQAPRIFPSFLLFEYTATLVGRLQFEVRALLDAAGHVAGVEQQGEPTAVSPA